MLNALKKHWPECLMEAAGLGIFMVSASAFTILLYHPASPALQALPAEFPRRALMGAAMGLTAIGIIYSPWGEQSGAHLNPAVTLTFFRLGKIEPPDVLFYVLSQFTGGLAGVLLVAGVMGAYLADPTVNYVATTPGLHGTAVAVRAEVLLSFCLMLVVLFASNTQYLTRFTGVFAGVLVAAYIILEAPWSGMSMNPARTFASALPAHLWTALWVYFTAPPLGMLLAAETDLRLKCRHPAFSAKLNHDTSRRCIFRCGYHQI